MFVLLLFSFVECSANHKLNSWFRTTLGFQIAEKWRIDAEVNYRGQNSFNSSNPFQHNLLIAFRPWLAFNAKENVVLGFSPVAYFRNFPVIRTEKDKYKSATNEWRFSAFIEANEKLANHLFAISRFCVEYRLFDNDPRNIVRLRFRMGLRYHLNQKISLQAFDEVFMNVGDYNKINSFDHNRVFTQINYLPIKNLRFEMGYMFAVRLPRNAVKTYPESNVVLNVAYNFSRKKKL